MHNSVAETTFTHLCISQWGPLSSGSHLLNRDSPTASCLPGCLCATPEFRAHLSCLPKGRSRISLRRQGRTKDFLESLPFWSSQSILGCLSSAVLPKEARPGPLSAICPVSPHVLHGRWRGRGCRQQCHAVTGSLWQPLQQGASRGADQHSPSRRSPHS